MAPTHDEPGAEPAAEPTSGADPAPEEAADARPGAGRRRVRYQVACSLDGYIAGPDGEIDWIVHDPAVDFAEIFGQFDTILMGRRTWEEMPPGGPGFEGFDVYVFSRTLPPGHPPGVTVVADDVEETLDALRARPGKDIWLFGGGELFHSLLELGQVDTVEPAVMPVLLGGGRPLLPSPAAARRLSLTGRKEYPSGIVSLAYDVLPESGT